MILVPAGQSIFNSLDEELGHLRRYSEEQLRQRMTEAGFDVETVLQFKPGSPSRVVAQRNYFETKDYQPRAAQKL